MGYLKIWVDIVWTTKTQENHHNRKSFNEEYQEFIRKYKFDVFVLG
jgi:hypothetical protein